MTFGGSSVDSYIVDLCSDSGKQAGKQKTYGLRIGDQHSWINT
jgi:hypothetical protein